MREVGSKNFDGYLRELLGQLRSDDLDERRVNKICDRWLGWCEESEITFQELNFALGLISRVVSIKFGDRRL